MNSDLLLLSALKLIDVDATTLKLLRLAQPMESTNFMVKLANKGVSALLETGAA